jgi:hypothetical protein
MISETRYSAVFNRLCHLAALSKEGKTKAAVDNILMTILAVNRTDPVSTAAHVAEQIEGYFGLTFNLNALQASIDRNLSNGSLVRDRESKALVLNLHLRADIEARINAAGELEHSVRAEWFSSIGRRVEGITQLAKEQLWASLRSYMAKAFRQHGVETLQLLDPSQPINDDNKKALIIYLREAVSEHCKSVSNDVAEESIRDFFINNSSLRTRYIAQLLDGTFTFFALSVDEATSEYLTAGIDSLALFLDSNFIFAVLGLHSDPVNDVTKELIDIIHTYKLPFKLYFHEETLLELRRVIQTTADHLKPYRWSQALSRAAISTGRLKGVNLRYHMKNAEAPIDPEVFLTKYEHMEQLLSEYSFLMYRRPPPNIDLDNERYQLVAEYKHYLEQRRPFRLKTYEAINHDMTIWQAAKGLRKRSSNIFGNGAFILSTDYLFYEFDWEHLRRDSDLGLCVFPNQFIQILRPLIPTTDDFDRRFVEVFAIPEFRTVGGEYSTTFAKVLSYLATFSDLSEPTAVSILTNEVLINHLNEASDEPKRLRELVDNALAEENEKLRRQGERFQEETLMARQQAASNEALVAQREQELRNLAEERRAIEVAAGEAERKAAEAEQKAAEAERKANETQRLADLNTSQKDSILAEMQQTIDRRAVAVRLLLALLCALIGFGLVFILPMIRPWNWFNEHPKRSGLTLSACLIVLGAAWMIADPKRRLVAALPLVLGAVLAVTQII